MLRHDLLTKPKNAEFVQRIRRLSIKSEPGQGPTGSRLPPRPWLTFGKLYWLKVTKDEELVNHYFQGGGT
jgi:hypothetical protein